MRILIGNIYGRFVRDDGNVPPPKTDYVNAGILPEDVYDKFSYKDPNAHFQQEVARRAGKPKPVVDLMGWHHFVSRESGRFGVGLLPDVLAYLDSKKYYYVITELRTNLIPSLDVKEDLLPNVTLRDYQVEALKVIVKWQNCLISVPTGGGKTLDLAALSIVFSKYRLLYLMDKVTLTRQTARRFLEYGIDQSEVCTITGDTYHASSSSPYTWNELSIKKARVVLCIQQMARQALGNEWEKFDGIIVDESHHSRAPVLTAMLKKAKNARLRVGTSGTVQSGNVIDDMQRRAYLGPVAYVLPTQELIDKGHLVKPVITFIGVKRKDVAMWAASGWKEIYDLGVSQFDQRNDIAMEVAMKLNGRTLVLFRLIEHGRQLMKRIGVEPGEEAPMPVYSKPTPLQIFLCRKHGYQPKSVYYLDGSVDPDTRDKAIAAFGKETHATMISSSLPSYEGICVQNSEGHIQIKSMKELFQIGIDGDLLGWKSLSMNGNGQISWEKITGIYRKKAFNPVIRATFGSNALDVHVTNNHSLIRPFNGKLKKIEPRIGNIAAIVQNVPPSDIVIRQLDIAKFFAEKKYPRVYLWIRKGPSQAQVRRQKQILRTLNHINQTGTWPTFADLRTLLRVQKWVGNAVKQHGNGLWHWTIDGKSLHNDLVWFFEHCYYHKGRWRCPVSLWPNFPQRFKDDVVIALEKSTNYLPVIVQMTPLLWRWLGLLIAEGSTTIQKTVAIAAISCLEGNEELRIVRGNVFTNKDIRELAMNGFKEITGNLAHVRTNKKAIWCHSRLLCWFLRDGLENGCGSLDRRVPWPVFHAAAMDKWEFLTGFYIGDGTSSGRHLVGLTSSSRLLIQGIVLLLRQLNIKEIYGASQTASDDNIRTVRGYNLSFRFPKIIGELFGHIRKKEGHQKNRYWKNICQDVFLPEIKSVKNTHRITDMVYDISVENNENFIAGTALSCCKNTIFDEGIDLPGIENLVICTGEKSFVKQIQRLGRALRPNNQNLVFVFDFYDWSNQTLTGHSEERMRIWLEEGHEIKRVEINDEKRNGD